MPLDNAQFISELSITDPTGTDPVNQGDDQIRTTKRATQQSFPNVDAAVTITAAQMNQMAIKNLANTFTLVNTFQASLRAANQTAVTPSYGFTSATGNGMFNVSATALAWATAGVERLRVSDTQMRVRSPKIAGADGTAADPFYTFEAQPTTGMYRPGTSLGFAVLGADVLFILPNQMRSVVNGTAALPAWSFNSSTNAGMYRLSSTAIAFAQSGVTQLVLSTVSADFAQRVFIVDGTAALPGLAFTNDGDTGLYNSTNGVTATKGVDLWAMSLNGMFAGVGLAIHAHGDLTSATKPGFAFNNDSDTGFYRANPNSCSIAAGGVTVLNFDFPTLAMWAGAGFAIRGDPSRVAAQPAFAYTNDTDTGMFRRAANAIGFASGGTEIFNIGSGGIGVISGKLCFFNLPTSPSTGGSLWNDGGTVKVA